MRERVDRRGTRRLPRHGVTGPTPEASSGPADWAGRIGNANVQRYLRRVGTTAPTTVQRDADDEPQLTSIRMGDSPRLRAAASNAPPLKRGDPDRDAVRRVQETLIDDGFPLPRSAEALTFDHVSPDVYSESTVDGKFGAETFAAIKAFQRKHELSDDGIVGRDTMTALDGVAARRTPSSQPLGGELPEGVESREFSREEYIAMWEAKHGRRMTGEERHMLAHGCIGITALNLQTAGSPPLDLSFSTFAKARSVAAALNRIVAAATALSDLSPAVVQAEPELVALENVLESLPTTGAPDQWQAMVFSKRFYSNQAEDWHDRTEADDDAFQPDPDTGQVDMDDYEYRARPNPDEGEGATYVNFDYGWFDEETDTWWHANHAEPDMQVYQSTLEHYSRPLRDFDRQVFTVAFARRI